MLVFVFELVDSRTLLFGYRELFLKLMLQSTPLSQYFDVFDDVRCHNHDSLVE